MHDSRSRLFVGIITTTLVAFSVGCSDEDMAGGVFPSTTSTGGGGSTSSISISPQASGGSTSLSTSSAGGGSTNLGGTSSTSTVMGSAGSSAVADSSGTAGQNGRRSTAEGGSTAGTTTTNTATGGTTTTATGGRTGGRTTVGGAAAGGTTRAGTTAGGSTTGGAVSTVPTGTVVFPEKFVGNIDTRGSIRSDFVKYWNQLTPENAGKWGSVQGSNQNTFNWNSLDTMYKYCNDNKIIFKEHCFVWGSQQPGWVNDSNAQAAVENWIKSFCQRYPNVKLIDVVNEPPPHTTPKYKNGLGGDGTSGWDWIANTFKLARQYCPGAILILNDYNNVELSGDARHTIDIVKAIKSVGAPIDAVGCQTHGASNLPSSTLKNNIDNIVNSTGLPVYITEYDIAQADDTKQLNQYKDHFQMFMSHPNIKGITIWGYIVGATWVNNTGIMNSDGSMRPAMTWLMSFLNRGH